MAHAKVWFITGASRGFGRIWAEAALKRGDKVVATARDTATLEALSMTFGDAVLPLKLDVTDKKRVFETVKEAQAQFGRIDVVLCNAGYAYMSAIEEIDLNEAQRNIDTNIFGTLSVIQAVMPILRAQQSGHILTMSSIGGLASFPTGGIYLATKFAVEAITEALGKEISAFGIKTTAIEPGSYSTGFSASTIHAPESPHYDGLRINARASFRPEMTGVPEATAAAILKLVDSPHPPSRLLLGNWLLPMLKQIYQDRIEEWESWASVSNEAQGTRESKKCQ